MTHLKLHYANAESRMARKVLSGELNNPDHLGKVFEIKAISSREVARPIPASRPTEKHHQQRCSSPKTSLDQEASAVPAEQVLERLASILVPANAEAAKV